MSAVVLGLIALAALTAPARAVPFAVDRLVAGDGQLTRDTASGLDWLDLTLTQSQSQASATGLTASGGLFEGFRLATVAEFQALVTNAGLVLGVSTDPLQFAASYSLQNLLGVTYSISDSTLVSSGLTGWLLRSPNGLSNLGSTEVRDYYPQKGTDFSTTVYYDIGVSDFANPSIGLFLVRNTPSPSNVSVPDASSTLGLFALSMAGLLAVRRRLAAAIFQS